MYDELTKLNMFYRDVIHSQVAMGTISEEKHRERGLMRAKNGICNDDYDRIKVKTSMGVKAEKWYVKYVHCKVILYLTGKTVFGHFIGNLIICVKVKQTDKKTVMVEK